MLLFNNTIVSLWWRTVIDAVKLVKEHQQIIRPEMEQLSHTIFIQTLSNIFKVPF